MTKEQATVEKLLAVCRSKPPKRTITISLADEMPDIMGLPKFGSTYNLRDMIMFFNAEASK